MQDTAKIPIVVILGSVRPNNYTRMAANLVIDALRNDPRVAVEVIDPSVLPLPLPGVDDGSPVAKAMRDMVATAAGVVLATPEYHGTFSSVIKLVIENLGFPSVLRGKPVALLGVAAGGIGAVKSLEHLRGVVCHVGALALPLAVSIANVQKTFDPEGRCLDPAIEKLVRGVATNLLDYLGNHVCPAITLERILREGAAAVTAGR